METQVGSERWRLLHRDSRLINCGRFVSPTRWPPFTSPGKFLVLISVRFWVDPRTIMRLEGLGKFLKIHLIGFRSIDLPACSIVPQPTTLHVALNRCRKSSAQCARTPTYRNCKLCLTARGTSSNTPGWSFQRVTCNVEQSACQVADRGPRYCPLWFHPKRGHWSWINTMFADSMRIVPCQEVVAVDVEHTLSRETCPVCYVKRFHLHCHDNIAIRKITCVEEDMSSVSSDMDAINRHEVLTGPSVGTVPVLVPCSLDFSTALVPQHWCPYSPWHTCIHVCHRCYTSRLTETLPQLSKHIRI
jgi:hypothetical protein